MGAPTVTCGSRYVNHGSRPSVTRFTVEAPTVNCGSRAKIPGSRLGDPHRIVGAPTLFCRILSNNPGPRPSVPQFTVEAPTVKRGKPCRGHGILDRLLPLTAAAATMNSKMMPETAAVNPAPTRRRFLDSAAADPAPFDPARKCHPNRAETNQSHWHVMCVCCA